MLRPSQQTPIGKFHQQVANILLLHKKLMHSPEPKNFVELVTSTLDELKSAYNDLLTAYQAALKYCTGLAQGGNLQNPVRGDYEAALPKVYNFAQGLKNHPVTFDLLKQGLKDLSSIQAFGASTLSLEDKENALNKLFEQQKEPVVRLHTV